MENMPIELKYGFILTMWYVNRDNYFEIKEIIYSFILTMWYVN